MTWVVRLTAHWVFRWIRYFYQEFWWITWVNALTYLVLSDHVKGRLWLGPRQDSKRIHQCRWPSPSSRIPVDAGYAYLSRWAATRSASTHHPLDSAYNRAARRYCRKQLLLWNQRSPPLQGRGAAPCQGSRRAKSDSASHGSHCKAMERLSRERETVSVTHE